MQGFVIKTVEGKSIEALDGKSILESALSSGVIFNYSCKNGQCGSCKATLLRGEVTEIQAQLSLHNNDTDNQFLTCCCTPTSDILIDSIDLSVLHGIEEKIFPARINGLDLLSENIIQVRLRLPPSLKLIFLEGQFIDIIKDKLKRSYSIATTPSDEHITLLIKRVDSGELSDYWFNKAQLNDLLRIEGPRGTFFLRNKAKSLVLLATGTGIAPIISILEGLDSDPGFNQIGVISLFWGNRVKEDFVWRPNFKKIKVNYYLSLSKSTNNWKGETGYVQDIALRKLPDVQNIDVYACGSRDMIDSAKISFVESGLSENNFYSDAFVQSF